MSESNSKIVSVVTGGSGFVGSHLVDLLLEKGHEVRCIIRKSSKTRWLEGKDVKIFDSGLYDVPKLKEILTGADYLFHVAGVVKAKNEEAYRKGNVETTKNLLDALLELKSEIKKVVVVSSLTAAGPAILDHPLTEEAPMNPLTRYGKSKAEQEALVKTYMDKLPIAVIRPPAVYGERDTEIYLMFKTFKQGLMTFIGFDKKQLSLVHAADLVNGIYLAGISDNSRSQTYFISSEKIYSWYEVADEMEKSIGKKAIRLNLPHFVVYTVAVFAEFFALFQKSAATFNIEKAKDFVQPAWTCDVSKARKELGYKQNVSLSAGVKRTVDWYRENKWL